MDKKLISWNVNGFRACLTKGFLEFFDKEDADIFCLQETKLQNDQIAFDGYVHGEYGKGVFDNGSSKWNVYWNFADKKGYSGTAIFSKNEPLSVSLGIGIDRHDHEGRVITLEFEDYYMVTVYTPNSQNELARLDYRMEWETDFAAYLKSLDEKKPVIVTGDMNVAHNEIDIKNPKANRRNAGFTDEERGKMTDLLSRGFTDSFRYKYPDVKDVYSWWSYRFNARKNNSGWRIDYFLVSERLNENIEDAMIRTEILGSDHCPVELLMR